MQSQRVHGLHAIAAAAAATLMPGLPTLAQAQAAAGADRLQRVEITAERRTTVLDTTPASVSALNGDKLVEAGLIGLEDVATLVPNMSFSPGFGGSHLFVRGIGNVFFIAGGDPGVALYSDGSYVSDQNGANVSLFDLQRVEVLRGPQGALYGRNAIGGAVNLISARPTDTFKAVLGLTFGQYGRKESEGFVSGPLGLASTSVRLSYQVKKHDGYVANPSAGVPSGPVIPGGANTVGPSRLDDLDSQAFRLQTATDFGGGANLRLIASSYRQSDAGPLMRTLPDPVMLSQLLFGVVPGSDPRSSNSQGASNLIDVKSVQALYERPLGDATLSVVASRRKSRAEVSFDSDSTESLTASFGSKTSSRDSSIDIHVASAEGNVQWIVGATWLRFDQRQDLEIPTQVPIGILVPGQPLNVPFPGGVDFRLGGEVFTRSSAVYGDLRYAVSQQLALTAGLRWNRDSKAAQEYQRVASLGLNGSAAPSDVWTSTPGSLGAEYKLGADALAYGKLSRGFKSGAVNLGALQPSLVKPETVQSIELGFKTAFLDRRGAFSAAIFSNRYNNMQVSQVGIASAILANASAAKISGLELEMSLRPVSSLTLSGGIGLMDPKYTNFVNVDLRNAPTLRVDVSGRQLALVSKAQANLSAEWQQSVGGFRTTVRGDCVWRDKFFFTEFNTPDAAQAGYGMLNLSASIRPDQGRWKLYAQLLNATNTSALTSMNIASPLLLGARLVTYTPPRRAAVGASFNF